MKANLRELRAILRALRVILGEQTKILRKLILNLKEFTIFSFKPDKIAPQTPSNPPQNQNFPLKSTKKLFSYFSFPNNKSHTTNDNCFVKKIKIAFERKTKEKKEKLFIPITGQKNPFNWEEEIFHKQHVVLPFLSFYLFIFPFWLTTSNNITSPTLVCASKKWNEKELNCVYKSDNCWETKSFMVEFLTLHASSVLLI